jgi:hypothetical protein
MSKSRWYAAAPGLGAIRPEEALKPVNETAATAMK